MVDNHPARWRLPFKVFRVVEDSMRPSLRPGDVLFALRGGQPRPGQLRVFPHPLKSTLWLVKRVGEVYPSHHGSAFEARSDNPRAARAGDSNEFGQVSAIGTYRVLWTVPARRAGDG